MSEPNWIESPLVADLEAIVARERDAGKVARHVTFLRLLDSWRDLVLQVERGLLSWLLLVGELKSDLTSMGLA